MYIYGSMLFSTETIWIEYMDINKSKCWYIVKI